MVVASDYYVSSGGSDANSGTSLGDAFASISRVNTLDLEPGDRVLFEGGASFSGTLEVSDQDRGAAGGQEDVWNSTFPFPLSPKVFAEVRGT